MIDKRLYLQRKIDAKKFYKTDDFYLSLAQELSEIKFPFPFTEVMKNEIALNLVGYMMDVVADLGLWRAFTSHCRTLYGTPVPFYEDADYIDYELNKADVRFMVWYSICFMGEPGDAPINPRDERILELADAFYEIMENSYDNAPRPEGMLKTNELEIHDPEDAEAIQILGQWVFWSSYLMVPCFKTNMAMIYSQAKPNDKRSLVELMGEAQMELPTGPLALYLREWIWLIVEGKLPPKPRHQGATEPHQWYMPFLNANDGCEIAFFNDYKALNNFLGKALGWDPDADNLPQLKNASDFTLLANEKKGLLIGRNVAQCFQHKRNPFYNPKFAEVNDFQLIIKRGFCPIDLTMYSLKNNMLPDLKWPGKYTDNKLSPEEADFTARCFLLQYYRAK